ncbi:hypothetical protein GCM10023224_14460 [Streptomonospora halophila]|uniref:Uncharacterized protein n=1 Tax=Streptomonospora halophila TaxID=427369 RepID=A0ABP9GBS0_9ACTN
MRERGRCAAGSGSCGPLVGCLGERQAVAVRVQHDDVAHAVSARRPGARPLPAGLPVSFGGAPFRALCGLLSGREGGEVLPVRLDHLVE